MEQDQPLKEDELAQLAAYERLQVAGVQEFLVRSLGFIVRLRRSGKDDVKLQAEASGFFRDGRTAFCGPIKIQPLKKSYYRARLDQTFHQAAACGIHI